MRLELSEDHHEYAQVLDEALSHRGWCGSGPTARQRD